MRFFSKWMSAKALDQDLLPQMVADVCPAEAQSWIANANWSWLEENGHMTFFLNPSDLMGTVARRDVFLAGLQKTTGSPWRWMLDGNTVVLRPIQPVTWTKTGISW